MQSFISKTRSGLYFPKRKRQAKDFRLPNEDLHVHRSVVHRLNSNLDGKKRLLILTKEDLFIALEGQDFTIAKIPLVINTCMHGPADLMTFYDFNLAA
jgi:hypothetical protein